MCEANVYLVDKNGNEKLLLESVDKVVPTEEGLLLVDIFSQRKLVKAKIKEMTLVQHRIILGE